MTKFFRAAVLSVFAFAALPAAAAEEPAALVVAIYQQVSAGKGTGGGQFVWLKPKDRPKRLSKSLVALWAKADAKTPKGEEGPIGFDPVTNSQDSLVRSFAVTTERQDAASATVAVALKGQPKAATTVVRYDLVLENGQWKIDDIRGSSGGEWSVRKILGGY
jgi:hypothetical protein